MALNRTAQPFYDKAVTEYQDKNYRQFLFTSGRAVQCRELTGIGTFADEHIKEIASLMYKDGTILSGCSVKSIDTKPRTGYADALSGLSVGLITMNGGKVFADGYPFEIEFEKFPNYSKSTIPIKLSGPETIYVEILDIVVTALEDDTLLDPATGYDNFESPGAHRLQKIARYISTAHKDYNVTGNLRFPILELNDGKVTYDSNSAGSASSSNENSSSLSSETNILDVLSQRTFETSGNYLVNGFRVKTAISPDNTKVAISVTPGVAYIGGSRIEMQNTYTGYVDKILVTSTVQGEEHAVEYETRTDSSGNSVYVTTTGETTTSIDTSKQYKIKKRYKLNASPVSAVDSVAVPVIGKSQLTYNASQISYITGLGGAVNKIIKCYVPTSSEPGTGDPESLPSSYIEFTEGTDFRFENQGILWLSTGKNPMSLEEGVRGTQFYVTYLYKPNLTSDQYSIEYSSIRETTMVLPVTNGVVSIPDSFYNPTVKSVVNPYNSASLEDNKQYYQDGNTVYVATRTSPTIPIRVLRHSNTNYDNLGFSGGKIKAAKYYSEEGVIYYRISGNGETNPDYRFYTDSGQIEWISSTNRPEYGEVYIAETEIGPGVYVDFGTNTPQVSVTFTYENVSHIYNNTCHDSYLVLSDTTKLSRSFGGGDNITINYEYARARTTSVALDASGKVAFYHGTVIDQDNNLTPVVPSSSLVMADVFIKPTTSEVYQITSHNSYRMRQTDLRDMFDRVKDIEYNISLNELETEAETKMAGSVLRGVFTDGFTSVKKIDNSMAWKYINSTDNQAIPLITEAKLSPNFRKCTVDLEVNSSKTTAGLFNNVYLMSKNYTNEVWLRQPYGTMYRSAAEGLDLMECFPSFSIDPDNDQFIEYEENEDLVYSDDDYGKKNCYIFAGTPAALISDGSIDFPAAKGSCITVQFWMYLDNNRNAQIISFNGNETGPLAIESCPKGFGFTTGNGDITGIKNEELAGYWRSYTFVFKVQADKATDHQIYINGEKQYRNSYREGDVGIEGVGTYIANRVIFGNKFRISGSFRNAKGYDFSGKIADIRLWNRALSEDEIANNFAKDLVGDETGLIGWWKNAISNGKISDSQQNYTKHDLVIVANGGYIDNDTGTVTTETRSFAKMLQGEDDSGVRGAVIKNVIDLTVGNVPDAQTELVLDPTKNAITVTGKYVTKNPNAVDQNKMKDIYYMGSGGKNVGKQTWEAYNTELTYYEKVTTQTDTILGDFVTDIVGISTLRKRVITVKGQGFLADTDLIGITFDGIPVQLYKLNDYNASTDGAPSSSSTEDRYWKTTSDGTFRCGFIIPDNVQIGVREVKLTAPGNIELKALYWGAGMKASKLSLTQSNETITWEPRTVIIGQEYINKDGWILLDGWSCRSRCGTTPLCQTFYVNDSSLTKPVITDIAVNSDVFLSSADVYFRTAGDCIDCIAGFIELTDSGVPRSDSGAGPSRFVGGVKVFDSKTINVTNGDPARATAAHNIAWENLVQLKGGQGYGFIVGSTDGNTTMWVASIENASKNVDVTTGTPVISEPDRGVLLSSPNGQTWAVYHYEDLKYTFYIANFFGDTKLVTAPESMRPSTAFSTTGKISYIEYEPVHVATASSNKLTAANFFMFEVNSQNSNDGSGFINYEYSIYQTNGEWSTWNNFTPGSTVFLSPSVTQIKIRLALYSYNPYSSPIVSKYACLTMGQFILPAIYTSITGTVGTWNTAEVYIDKFFDETLSTVDLYISPDQGYTWRKMENALELIPLSLDSSRYNGATINQFHYQCKLTIPAPTIKNLQVVNGSAGDFVGGAGDWEFAMALVDGQGNESPLSESVTIRIPSNSSRVKFTTEFDPNATGFRIYAKKSSQAKLYLFYDSTATASLAENLASNTTTSQIVLGSGGERFPYSGTVMIDNEYIRYSSNTKRAGSDGTYQYVLGGTGFSRNVAHNGRVSILGSHTTGTTVYLVNEGFAQQDSPTPCISGIWRFPNYSINKDVWTFTFTATDALGSLRDTDLINVNPSYDEDFPANFTSEYMTFRIEMKDMNNATTVTTLDKIPGAGRLMISTGLERY